MVGRKIESFLKYKSSQLGKLDKNQNLVHLQEMHFLQTCIETITDLFQFGFIRKLFPRDYFLFSSFRKRAYVYPEQSHSSRQSCNPSKPVLKVLSEAELFSWLMGGNLVL